MSGLEPKRLTLEVALAFLRAIANCRCVAESRAVCPHCLATYALAMPKPSEDPTEETR